MGGIEHVKVGDCVRITETIVNEGEVVNVGHGDTLALKDGRWIDTEEYGDHHSVTVEVVEKPREIGWWEVEKGGTPRVMSWDGWNWSYDAGCITGYPDEVQPLRYIGKGSLDE